TGSRGATGRAAACWSPEGAGREPESSNAWRSAAAPGGGGGFGRPRGGLRAAALIDWPRRYLGTVQALTGRVPIVYTYPHFWRTAMADTDEFTRYPLWIADYRDNDDPEVPGGWPHWTFWQTTDSGRIDGIAGNTDLNRYSGAQGDFARFANM
ncbi:glycoside hydrolase family 25 protein, partial [Nocardia brasiliensis]|uniref:glycoside hydrolase family 25 protein n=1 Tax=Nocardia brasiliensis TaxID=37326 RepID=UPI0024585F07